MIVTRARLADVDILMERRRELTSWLADRGVDQWSIPLPRSAVAATVGSGQTWIVHSNREPVATLTWLRLDAWTTNPALHNYYRRRGFQHVRTVASRISGACFQRPAQPYLGPLKTDE